MLNRYKHILVPLDGSKRAELALADAFSIAQLNQAEVTLFHVVPPTKDVQAANMGVPIPTEQRWDMLALRYLDDVCKQGHRPNITVHTAVDTGQAAETILNYAHFHAIDLIVMSTHGRTGLSRWVYGSVANKVLRGADIPVLLVRNYSVEGAA